jgi:hypothetical protein
MNASSPDRALVNSSTAAFDASQLPALTGPSIFLDKEWLDSIRDRLGNSDVTLPERIVATLEEDYWQLLRDFGLR